MEELTNADIAEDSKIPPTIYVIKFNPKVSSKAIKWLLDNIEDHGKDNGADLIIKSEPNRKKGQGVTIHITASRLLKSATWQPQTQYQSLKVHDVESLSEAEREFCIRHIMMTTRANTRKKIPGHENVVIYPGQSLVTVYQEEYLIDDLFPLHNSKKLEAIENKWCYEFSIRTPKDIQSYFGESVAMYFQFLEFYTVMLIFPALLGFVLHMFSVDSLTENALFAVFNLVWITIFLKRWKRKCSALAFEWGTLSRSDDQEIQAHFTGDLRLNSITMHHETYYPVWKTYCKVFTSSLIVGICTLCALVLGVLYANGDLLSWLGIYLKKSLRKKWIINKIYIFLPSIIYAVIIAMVNGNYRNLAAFLTKWENHRLQGSYNWHYVSKLLVFEFVNNFSSLFYIAFYDQDWDKLRSWVATMLIVMQMINQFQETLLPFLFKEASFIISKRFSIRENNHSKDAMEIGSLDEYDPRIEQAEMEAQKDSYEDAIDDYLEMFMQFGYVSMFSCAYPMASFWALINNLTEIKFDAFKFCNVYQRPKVKRVSTIGVWQDAFELLGVIGVATNCALLCLSPTLQSLTTHSTLNQDDCESPQYENEWILIFVLLEHFILGVKFAFSVIIPDQPKWVRDKQEMIMHQAEEAHTKMIIKNLKNSPWGKRLLEKNRKEI